MRRGSGFKPIGAWYIYKMYDKETWHGHKYTFRDENSVYPGYYTVMIDLRNAHNGGGNDWHSGYGNGSKFTLPRSSDPILMKVRGGNRYSVQL